MGPPSCAAAASPRRFRLLIIRRNGLSVSLQGPFFRPFRRLRPVPAQRTLRPCFRRFRPWSRGTSAAGTREREADRRPSALAAHFAEVVATDASADQIAHATPHPRVTYRAALAERSGLKDGWADLVTAGQAVHWFDQKRFFEEVNRVAAPGGAVAVWAYDLFDLEGEAGAVVRRFHSRVEPYWPPERALVARRYADLFFPFEEIPVLPVDMTARVGSRTDARLPLHLVRGQGVSEGQPGRPDCHSRARTRRRLGLPGYPRTVTWPLVLRAGRIA